MSAREFWIRKSKKPGRTYFTVRERRTGEGPPIPGSTISDWLYTDWFLVIEKSAYEELTAEILKLMREKADWAHEVGELKAEIAQCGAHRY